MLFTPAGVVLVQVVLERVPSASHSYHHVLAQDSHEDKVLRVADLVLALTDPDHGKLNGTSALAQHVLDHLVEGLEVAVDSLLDGTTGRRRGKVFLLLLLFLFIHLDLGVDVFLHLDE